KAAAEIGRIGAGITTVSGEPVDNTPVAPNAGGGLPVVIIAPEIKLVNSCKAICQLSSFLPKSKRLVN
ncbi:1800_t:CDS:2, partial [Funneliformis geosporum]